MKSRIQKKEASKGRPITDYPCYGISNDALIILFHCDGAGCVIKQGDTEYSIGPSAGWDMDCFTVFEDELVVSN